MDERTCDLCDKIRCVKQCMEILKSTLLAIYVAGTENVYDATSYMEAVHGSVELAMDSLTGLREILELLQQEETS